MTGSGSRPTTAPTSRRSAATRGCAPPPILQDDAWIVRDAVRDPRTLANPLVAGEFGLQFYAGVPLRTPDGYNLGTFCILDREPREFSAEDTPGAAGPGGAS